jgi:hypothetical protein
MINPPIGGMAVIAQRNASLPAMSFGGSKKKYVEPNEVCFCLSSGKAIDDEFYECELCNSTGIYPPILHKRKTLWHKIVDFWNL